MIAWKVSNVIQFFPLHSYVRSRFEIRKLISNFYNLSAESAPPRNDIAPDNLELAYFSIELDAQSEFFYTSFSFQFLLPHPQGAFLNNEPL